VNFSSLFTFSSQLIANCRNYRDIFVTGEHSGNDRMLGRFLGQLSQGYPDCFRIRRRSEESLQLASANFPETGTYPRQVAVSQGFNKANGPCCRAPGEL
ncbi:MAG: hypothetical protein WAN72_16305, partial [Candidatus Acidiferrales bacterium]